MDAGERRISSRGTDSHEPAAISLRQKPLQAKRPAPQRPEPLICRCGVGVFACLGLRDSAKLTSHLAPWRTRFCVPRRVAEILMSPGIFQCRGKQPDPFWRRWRAALWGRLPACAAASQAAWPRPDRSSQEESGTGSGRCSFRDHAWIAWCGEAAWEAAAGRGPAPQIMKSGSIQIPRHQEFGVSTRPFLHPAAAGVGRSADAARRSASQECVRHICR